MHLITSAIPREHAKTDGPKMQQKDEVLPLIVIVD